MVPTDGATLFDRWRVTPSNRFSISAASANVQREGSFQFGDDYAASSSPPPPPFPVPSPSASVPTHAASRRVLLSFFLSFFLSVRETGGLPSALLPSRLSVPLAFSCHGRGRSIQFVFQSRFMIYGKVLSTPLGPGRNREGGETSPRSDE